jgi:hypothetical protein
VPKEKRFAALSHFEAVTARILFILLETILHQHYSQFAGKSKSF